MALISLQDVSLAFGGPPLLNHLDFHIQRGERVCLLGRNGAGKSTLMRLMNGDLTPDAGEVIFEQDVKIALLAQEVPQNYEGTIHDVVARGLDNQTACRTSPICSRGWSQDHQVERIISRMNLAPNDLFRELSAGLKRRVMLARGLVCDPDILLLDEPTNHLDIEAISWLEDFLSRYRGTMLFVTHDRMFLQRLAMRIVELDRGRLIDWSCDYETFQQRKEAVLEAESLQWARFDKKLAVEETWIRQGVKARRTRNEGRVRELERMREERRARVARTGSARMKVQEAVRSGKLVIEAEGVSYSYNNEMPVIHDFSTVIMRGDKVGIIGPNGAGKTTLLRLLLGELTPVKGSVRHGSHVEIAYFDQLRDQLDEDRSVAENVGGGNDTIYFNGKPRHIIGYLKDFLFTPERARSPVRILSGGERNRLLLARLFTRPSNVLVMDEPTNDLDAETLELLEELLLEYAGTLLLISHDRTFLNNVVTSTLVFEGEGSIVEYVGGYEDWLRQRRRDSSGKPAKSGNPNAKEPNARARRQALSYKDARELEALPQRIENLEAEQSKLYEAMSDPSFYRQDGAAVGAARTRLQSIEEELAQAYERWEILEALNGADS